ncbi:PREDICTED: probable rhamnogalacturonate lyase B isoform X3 [Ipomoea nil]|nr:PREDICTED: probable rhamnogalacturonate lyase B isoform X3 [Ipomoea nil]XP_019177550.1 PREDICTED: probable rhamnogalacturonate lyase B isoform X3 [Ipomoea nil]
MGCGLLRRRFLDWWHLEMIIALLFLSPAAECRHHHQQRRSLKGAGVQLDIQDHQAVMNNGILSVSLSVPDGLVTGISYQGIKNLLETKNPENDRGYWDAIWHGPGIDGELDKLQGTSFEIITNDESEVEISFTRTWDASQNNVAPVHIDKRFIMLRDTPGFYTYAIFQRLEGFPGVRMEESRVVFKPRQDLFHYMAVSDDRQRFMPMPEDRLSGQVLDYPEAVLLTRPSNRALRGEVDDKYFYSSENKDNKVHGWVCTDPPVGIWMITPSSEFRIGGPFKQELTSHVGPTMLSTFVSRHYAGEDLDVKFQDGEPWTKVLGPVFVYLNTDTAAENDPSVLWNDAKNKMNQEVASWPYDFVHSIDYMKSDQRGIVRGRLFVRDWFVDERSVPASYAYVGLAMPGAPGSWQRENKGYQFWTQADNDGNFFIKGVRAGTYNLYATVPGRIGDYKYVTDISVIPGSDVELGDLVYKPPRNGATLWEIGVADRTAAEFYVPTPSPMFRVHDFEDEGPNKFREYGLWKRYTDLYPLGDLVYTVGTSDYARDWFYAHVTRSFENGTYGATTWSIVFDLESVNRASYYTLQLALASAQEAELQVRFNDGEAQPPHFTTGIIGSDNAIARHGIHGLYWLFSVRIAGTWLVQGRNIIFLTQAGATSPWRGVMYDYIRLEGPDQYRDPSDAAFKCTSLPSLFSLSISLFLLLFSW